MFFSEDNRDNSDNGKNGRNCGCHEVTYNRDNEITVVSLFFLVKLVSYSQIVNFTKSTGSFLALGKFSECKVKFFSQTSQSFL